MRNPHIVKIVVSIGLLALTPAGLSRAQDSGDVVEASANEQAMAECLDSALAEIRSSDSCIGTLTSACLSSAITTVDMIDCYGPETEFWETRMMSAYAELSEAYHRQDEEDDPIRALVPRLEHVQTQWAHWRDAKCGFENDKFRGGSLGRVVSTDCRLQETAERALELEELLEETEY